MKLGKFVVVKTKIKPFQSWVGIMTMRYQNFVAYPVSKGFSISIGLGKIAYHFQFGKLYELR